MIYLFNVKARNEVSFENNLRMRATVNRVNLVSDAADYIFAKYNELTEYMHANDKEGLRYVEKLYQEVINDESIKEEERSMDKLLDKLEDDLDGGNENVNQLFVLNFLEASFLRTSKDDPNSQEEQFLLGRIYRIRKKYFTHKAEIDFESYKPVDIKKYIDEFVMGQESAKITIATAVYNHLKRMRNPDINFPADVVLLIGPSGCGKTEIMRRIRDLVDLPMVFTDVSGLGASQVGKTRKKEDILINLLNEAKGDITKAQNGIIFLDEFDKLTVPAISDAGEDLHARVQGQLLTMLEGSDAEINYQGSDILFNTSHILFVLAGAFEGIEQFIKTDKDEANINIGIGFTAIPKQEVDLSIRKNNINHRVLIDYGMKRELAGRIEDIAILESLSKEDYVNILKNSKDSIIQKYKKEIKFMCGARLVFEDDAIEEIVNNISSMQIGARALNGEVRKVMRKILFMAPKLKAVKTITITKATVQGKEQPRMEME